MQPELDEAAIEFEQFAEIRFEPCLDWRKHPQNLKRSSDCKAFMQIGEYVGR